eukprot:12916978-Alexandrium_andersonii.AAC.1
MCIRDRGIADAAPPAASDRLPRANSREGPPPAKRREGGPRTECRRTTAQRLTTRSHRSTA